MGRRPNSEAVTELVGHVAVELLYQPHLGARLEPSGRKPPGPAEGIATATEVSGSLLMSSSSTKEASLYPLVRVFASGAALQSQDWRTRARHYRTRAYTTMSSIATVRSFVALQVVFNTRALDPGAGAVWFCSVAFCENYANMANAPVECSSN